MATSCTPVCSLDVAQEENGQSTDRVSNFYYYNMSITCLCSLFLVIASQCVPPVSVAAKGQQNFACQVVYAVHPKNLVKNKV